MDQLVQTWLDLDRDAETRHEIEHLRENNDINELQVRLGTSKSFACGTLS